MLIVLALFSCQKQSSNPKSDFYFVQITDTHWGDNDNLSRTRAIVDSINKLSVPITFVAHTGDLTAEGICSGACVDSGFAIMKKLRYPVIYAAGNRDISEENYKAESEAFAKNCKSICEKREINNVCVVNLFNFWISDTVTGKTIYDPSAKLDSLLSGVAQNEPILIFQHDPMVNSFYENAFHEGDWDLKSRNKYFEICHRYNVKGIFAGHFHRDEIHWDGYLPIFVSEPIAADNGHQASFRVYHYLNGQISYFTQYIMPGEKP